jgi:predicted RNA-binding Zn ribbon-like protein
VADGGLPAAGAADGHVPEVEGAEVAGRGLRWDWSHADDLRTPLWPITHAATNLLAHGPPQSLKVCANCRWLFLDQSRNRSRRWCSMENCGTAVKKERYVERRRARRAAS